MGKGNIVQITILGVLIIGAVYIIWSVSNKADNVEIGMKAVRYMYHFQSLKELDDNMDRLKKITSDEVYEKLTIDNTDRTLRVYLKFRNKPVIVNVEKATENYVIYSLISENISANRKFVFFFETNREGTIVDVRESEVVDFVAGN